MKKLTITLALILCLVLCVFAFASCGKKTADATTGEKTAAPTDGSSTTAAPTEPATTTEPEETEPAHVHTPEADWEIESDPTCTTPGKKVRYCEECGLVAEEEIIPIDPNAHDVVEWSAEPTLLNPTVEATGECAYCHQTISETFTYEPPIKTFTTSGVKYKPVSVTLGDVRGEGKHFYPDESNGYEGNDLYVEFSILWNETLGNLDAAYMIGSVGGKPFFFLAPYAGAKYADSPFAGTFEWMGHFEIPISDSEVTTPAGMCGPSENFSDYPNIAGTDQEHPEYGWHRMGIRVHMELLDGKTGEELSDYIQISTIFVDGVPLCKLSTTATGLASNETKLFTAAPDEGGNVVYSDMDENTVVPFEIPTAKSKTDTTACIAIDDVSVTCGHGFVMQVEKVTNPTAATYEVEEGVEIPSTVWFKLAD